MVLWKQYGLKNIQKITPWSLAWLLSWDVQICTMYYLNRKKLTKMHKIWSQVNAFEFRALLIYVSCVIWAVSMWSNPSNPTISRSWTSSQYSLSLGVELELLISHVLFSKLELLSILKTGVLVGLKTESSIVTISH